MGPGPSTRDIAQGLLLRLYAMARQTGLFETSFGRWIFEKAYDLYKRWIESADLRALRPFVAPGTLVIDVGANAGFYTVQFARWVSDGGRVLAIEPEAENLTRLRRALRERRLQARVDVIAAAAASGQGPTFLKINPDHPGDHRLAADGLAIHGITLDGTIADLGWPSVSLIKIDVQGAEAAVLAGACEVLRRFHPALYIEIDARYLREFGSTPAGLIAAVAEFGYTPYRFSAGTPVPLDQQLLLRRAEASYIDVLFLRF